MTDRWHIIGAGAIGSLLATQLQEAGSQVCLLHRNAASAAQAPQPLQRLVGDLRSEHSLQRLGAAAARNIAGLVITTKAGDVLPAFLSVASQLNPGAPVILLHNGLGIYERMLTHYPATQVYCAITTEGAYLDDSGRLIHAGQGQTWVGQPDVTTAGPQLAALLAPRGRWQWDTQVRQSLWRKLMINCAINPLTAINQCHNGALNDDPLLRKQTRALVAELAAVSAAAGYDQVATELEQTVFGVIRDTANNTSSMRQDLLRGRATEIDAITGYCCRQAQQLDIATPLNWHLQQRVQELGGQMSSCQ